MGRGQNNPNISRGTVRRGMLEEEMKAHDAEIGRKMATWGAVYHERYIQPMTVRLAYLELPFYKRWWFRTQALLMTTSHYARLAWGRLRGIGSDDEVQSDPTPDIRVES